MKTVNPIDIEVTNKLLSSIAAEMGIVVQRAAFSPNIKERRDFSCAVFDGKGRLLAQAAHIPVHLGAMPLTVSAVTRSLSLGPGDVVITNDPFLGGTHLPDVTLMSGVFHPSSDRPLFYVVTRAHHTDIGGTRPGSMPLARHIDEEGVRIPPAFLVRNGELEFELLEAFLERVRHPWEREGDLRAQLASLERGQKRLLDLVDREGVAPFDEKCRGLVDYGTRVMETVLSEIPAGVYTFEDALDDDGLGRHPVPIRVTLEIAGGRARVDFTRSADQVPTGLNTVRSVTCSAVYYVFSCLTGGAYPINAGSLQPLEVITRPGSLMDARPPAPVAVGNVETSQRIVDCLLGALGQAVPERIPAASCGSMNNVLIGDEGYAYYETLGGGMGGRRGLPGLSGVQVHMTNTLNTPVEALEQAYPLFIEAYALRTGSGGAGRFRGGDGLIRRYRFEAPATVTLLTERRRLAPYGLHGGGPGKRGLNRYRRREDGRWKRLPGKTHLDAEAGDVLEIRTPGGGGWGPLEKDWDG